MVICQQIFAILALVIFLLKFLLKRAGCCAECSVQGAVVLCFQRAVQSV